MDSFVDHSATRAVKMDQTLKSRKEEFVSNLSGGDISEINLVTLVAPAAIVLWSALQSRQSFFVPSRPTSVAADFLLNVGMVLLATTVYSSAPSLLLGFLLTPALFISITSHLSPTSKEKPLPGKPRGEVKSTSAFSSSSPLPIQPFLSNYRGAMMIATCLAILAVDFRVFPRRFAKVETWGTSLMDLGVGSFVFSAGVVSARSLVKTRLQVQSERSLPSRLRASLSHSLPLLILGLFRLISVKNLSYAEHVTEYGVHWNFFFTLAFLAPFVEVIENITVLVPSYEILTLLLCVAYQILLDSTSLTSYILLSPRGSDLLSQNREGVFSFAGYLAIFIAGRGFGVPIFSPAAAVSSKSKARSSTSPWKERKSLLFSLTWRALLYTTSFLLTHFPFSFASVPVSRRLANLPYVLWVSAFNAIQVLLFCGIETLFFHSRAGAVTQNALSSNASAVLDVGSIATSRILAAFNNNGLAVFLGANLLTGAVNLSVNTLDMGFLGAMSVLTLYAVTITILALGLDRMGWKLKV